jgi:hypothetical protein
MPYKVFCFRDEDKKIIGYKVGKKDGEKMINGRKYASNKYLDKKEANNQLQAILISEANKDI